MRIRMRGALGAAILGLSVGMASAAGAAPVNVEFDAVIRLIHQSSEGSEGIYQEIVEDLHSLGVVVDAPIQGTLRYDDAAAPLSPTDYDGSALDLAFQVGDLSASLGPPPGGTIFAVDLGQVQLVQLGGMLDLGPLSGELRGGSLLFVGENLEDWTDGSLPAATPELDEMRPFEIALLLDDDPISFPTTFAFGLTRCIDVSPEFAACATVSIAAELTRLETVPEPGGLAALALLALSARLPRRLNLLWGAVPLVMHRGRAASATTTRLLP